MSASVGSFLHLVFLVTTFPGLPLALFASNQAHLQHAHNMSNLRVVEQDAPHLRHLYMPLVAYMPNLILMLPDNVGDPALVLQTLSLLNPVSQHTNRGW
jgi:hypothetical protein